MAVTSTMKVDQAKSPHRDLHYLFNSSSHGVMLTDQQGTPLYWNKSLLLLLGLEGSTIEVQTDRLTSALEERVKNSDNFEIRLRQIYSNQQNTSMRVTLKDEKILEVDIQWQALSDGNQSCLWSLHDVSAENAKVKHLQGIKDRYEAALCGSEEGVWDWDLRENVLYISPRWEKILVPETVKTQKEALHSLWDLCLYIPSEERDALEEKLNGHMKSNRPFFEVEFPIRTDRSRFLWVRMRGLSLRNENKEIYRMSGSIADITSRKISDTRQRLAGLHDRLTGLPNLVLFKKKLSETLKAKSKRKMEREQGYTFSILVLRLSRFGIINESFGPDYGDRVIKEISHRLKQLTRQEDFLARLEGNKFGLILQNISTEEELRIFAKRVQEVLNQPIELEEQSFVIESKMGAILPPPHYAKVEDVLHECTKALAQTKKGNKNLCILAGNWSEG